MGQNILQVQHGSCIALIDTTEQGTLELTMRALGGGTRGVQAIKMEMTESDSRAMREALDVYIESRQTRFNVGDIVYEHKNHHQAGEVIAILEDRAYFTTPYRVRFLHPKAGQPETYYLCEDDLALVFRKGEG